MRMMMVMGLSFSSYSWSMYQPEDMAIVDEITQQSNITESDVNKYKLLFLRGFAPLAAIGSTGYAAFKAGQTFYSEPTGPELISKITGTIGQYVPADYQAYIPSESTQAILKNNVLWAGVAAGGVALAMFPVLYSRTKEGIVSKIQKFDAMCHELPVATIRYPDVVQLEAAFDPSWRIGNPIAWCAVFDNLVAQGGRAQKLLNQMHGWGINVSDWQNNIDFYNKNLKHNSDLLAPQCNVLINNRRNERGSQIDLASRDAKLTSQRINNATKVFSFIKDIANTGVSILEFGEEHKGKIATGILGGMAVSKWDQWFGAK